MVRRALRSDGSPHYQRPARLNPQLVPYEAKIHVWYFGQHLIGSRILRELRKIGYTGGPTALYAYLKRLRAAGRLSGVWSSRSRFWTTVEPFLGKPRCLE